MNAACESSLAHRRGDAFETVMGIVARGATEGGARRAVRGARALRAGGASCPLLPLARRLPHGGSLLLLGIAAPGCLLRHPADICIWLRAGTCAVRSSASRQ